MKNIGRNNMARGNIRNQDGRKMTTRGYGNGRNGNGRNGNGRTNTDHFHPFQDPTQEHLQNILSTHPTTAQPPTFVKHTHSSGNIGLPSTHRHALGRNTQRHWGRNPGTGPQGGYTTQSTGGPGVHGYEHKHVIGGGRGRGGRGRGGSNNIMPKKTM